MSLLGEIMQEARGIINEHLGDNCLLKNTLTGHQVETKVIISNDVEIYQGGQLAGVATVGVFDLTACNPQIDNQLTNLETGITYYLSGVKTETTTKAEFILSEA